MLLSKALKLPLLLPIPSGRNFRDRSDLKELTTLKERDLRTIPKFMCLTRVSHLSVSANFRWMSRTFSTQKEPALISFIEKLMKSVGIKEGSPKWNAVGKFLNWAEITEQNFATMFENQKKIDDLVREYRSLKKLPGEDPEDIEARDAFTLMVGGLNGKFIEEAQKVKNPPAEKLDPQALLLPDIDKRDAETFVYLKNLNSIEERIGQLIPLPNLGQVPKEMEEYKATHFFLTRERFEALKKVWVSIRMNEPNKKGKDTQAGMIPSGPHGISKSSLAYFIACVAYINNSILLYVNNCGEWVDEESDPLRAQWLLQRFIDLNALLLQDIPISAVRKDEAYKYFGGSTNLLDLARFGSTSIDYSQRAQSMLLKELGRYKQTPVFYLFDEHQHLWRDERRLGYFSNFKTFTGPTQGLRTYTIYVGSANSQFEDNLPKGAEMKYPFYVQPFSSEEFKKVTTLPDTPFRLSTQGKEPVGKDAKKVQDIVKKEGLGASEFYHTITGGAPREMLYLQASLAKDPTANEYMSERISTMRTYPTNWEGDQLKEWHKTPGITPQTAEKERDKTTKLFFDFLDKLFSPYYYGEVPTGKYPLPGRFYDRGLILFDTTQRVFRPFSLMAQIALQQYYYANRKLEKISRTAEGGVQGSSFEQWVKHKFSAGSVSKIEGFAAGKPVSVLLPPNPTVITFNFKLGDYPANITNFPAVYVPKVTNFGSWDLIVHIPETNHFIFIQVAINGYKKHEEKVDKVAKSFKREYIKHVNLRDDVRDDVQETNTTGTTRTTGTTDTTGTTSIASGTTATTVEIAISKKPKRQRSQIEQIIDGITGKVDHEASINNNNLEVVDPDGKKMRVDFAFFSGTDEKEVAEYSNLIIVPKRFSKEDLQIPFEY